MKLKKKLIVCWSIVNLATIAGLVITYLGIAFRCWFSNPNHCETEYFNRLGEMSWEMPLVLISLVSIVIWIIYIFPKIARILNKWANED